MDRNQPIPDDDLGRAFLDAANVIGCLHLAADGVAGRLPTGPHSITIPVTGGDKPTALVLSFPAGPSSREEGLRILRRDLPGYWRAIIQSFPPIRFELAGLTASHIQEGTYSGASAHFIAWVMAQDAMHARELGQDLELVEELNRTVNFDRLTGQLEAEYATARRARDSQSKDASRGGYKGGPVGSSELDNAQSNSQAPSREDGVNLDDIPELDPTTRWATAGRAAEIEGLSVETLANYRSTGQKSADGLKGRDRDGRAWRKPGPRAHTKYLRSSLKNSGK